MQTESPGQLIPKILLPYAQQWAERSGMTLLSRLLVDENLRALLEKYGDEMVQGVVSATSRRRTANSSRNGYRPAPVEPPGVHETPSNGDDMARLLDRVSALEAEQRVQQALFEAVRTKIGPLALALGCCPECLVGVGGCPKCGGRSTVGYYPPDRALLESEVIRPLAARGVPLSLNGINHQPTVVSVGNGN
jgi:hypothetical protein